MKKLFSICWNLTSRCNCRCKYCYRDTTQQDLTVAENITIIDRLKRYGIKKLTFTGGELTLYDGFADLIRYSHAVGIYTNVVTNAKETPEQFYDVVCKAADCLTVSIDTMDIKMQMRLGRDDDHFVNVMNLLRRVRERPCSIDLKANSVATKINRADLVQLLPVLYENRIYTWKVLQFSPLRYQALVNKELFMISSEEFENVRERLTRENKRLGGKVRIVFQSTEELMDSYIVIASNGDVLSETSEGSLRLGNLLDLELDEIMEHVDFNYDENIKRHNASCVS